MNDNLTCLSKMFPPSLHKNIRELDKQITLLESECENMETGKLKKGVNAKIYFSKPKEVTYCKRSVVKDVARPFITLPRVPDANALRTTKHLSTTKVCPKSSVNSTTTTRKSLTNRETSTTTSDELNKCSKCNLSKNCVRNCRYCGRSGQRPQSAIIRDKKTQGNTYNKEPLNCEKNRDSCDTDDKQNESDHENHVLHKGILHTNPGGTIEVTVTQKSHKSPLNAMNPPCRRSSCSAKDVGPEKGDAEAFAIKQGLTTSAGKIPLRKATKNRKWSEILSGHENGCLLDQKNRSNKMKNNDIKDGYSVGSTCVDHHDTEPNKHGSVRDAAINVPTLKLDKCDKEHVSERWNDENECPQTPVSTGQKKCRPKSNQKRRNLENVIDASPRSEIGSYGAQDGQCERNNVEKTCLSEELFDLKKSLCNLVDALKKNFTNEEIKRLLHELEVSMRDQNEEVDDLKECDKDRVEDDYELYGQDSEYVEKLHEHILDTKNMCERLMEERNKLTEDLADKDRLLLNLTNKEKEYLATIENLKASLEKRKLQVEDNVEILTELNKLKNKLVNETKVADALRKSHAKMQEQVQKCMLENDKLKTEIRLNKLESQKFCVLLAGKDAEIKRYKDEVESFQRHITEQLAALRSNNAANEVQKAMEAIFRQSQTFNATDLDSAFSETHTDGRIPQTSSKQRDRLMHSSPTSTKSSLSDLSWNHISSIHEDDAKSNNENDDNVFEDAGNESESEVLIGDLRESGKGGGRECEYDAKKMSSFVSCKSADDASMTEGVTRLEESASVYSDDAKCDKLNLLKPKDGLTSIPGAEKLKRNIEELLEDLRTKCSQRIMSIPSDSVLFGDLFSSSEASNLSGVSGNFGCREKMGKA